ncbi:MAG: MFS transporter [bacterium]
MSESSTGKILFLSIVVSLGGFLFGYDAAVISGVVGFIVSEFQLNAWQTGFVVAAPSMTAIAAISAGPISDHFGRKKILLIISFLYIVSAAASAWAPNYWSLVVARAIGGLAFASLALAPIYITEIAPAHLRGRLVSKSDRLGCCVGG